MQATTKENLPIEFNDLGNKRPELLEKVMKIMERTLDDCAIEYANGVKFEYRANHPKKDEVVSAFFYQPPEGVDSLEKAQFMKQNGTSQMQKWEPVNNALKALKEGRATYQDYQTLQNVADNKFPQMIQLLADVIQPPALELK
jgi:hypothetical protein